MNSTISIIVPVYNIEQFLDRCIDSIINQSHRDLEIILVDDGSTDNSGMLCDEWALRDSRIVVIHKRNGGLSDARNAGLKIASGKYIGFVDSDDWIAPRMYELLLDSISESNSDLAVCAVLMKWDTGKEELLAPQINCILDSEEAQLELLRENILKQPVWNKLYKKNAIQDIMFEAGKAHEDVYWTYRVIGRAKKISVIDYVGYLYYQRNDSIMGMNYSTKRLDAIQAYCNRYEYYKQNYPKLTNEALYSIWTECIYHGQMILKKLKGYEQSKSIDYLKSILKSHPITRDNYKSERITHRIWIDIARISLVLVCRIKNMMKVGL